MKNIFERMLSFLTQSIAVIFLVTPSIAYSSSLCEIDGVRFFDIADNAIDSSLGAVLSRLESSPCFDASTRELNIADKLQIMGGDKQVSKKWIVSEYDNNKKGFFVQIPNGQYSFSLPSFRGQSQIYSCQNNQVSSGVRVIEVAGTVLRVIESWSCGSAGCSYGYFFSGNAEEATESFCEKF